MHCGTLGAETLHLPIAASWSRETTGFSQVLLFAPCHTLASGCTHQPLERPCKERKKMLSNAERKGEGRNGQSKRRNESTHLQYRRDGRWRLNYRWGHHWEKSGKARWFVSKGPWHYNQVRFMILGHCSSNSADLVLCLGSSSWCMTQTDRGSQITFIHREVLSSHNEGNISRSSGCNTSPNPHPSTTLPDSLYE